MRALSLSIKTYAIIFIAGVALLFGALSWAALSQIASARADIERKNRLAAEREIVRALARLDAETNRLGRVVATWDESRQQLSDPSYYTYWRDNRVLQGTAMPPFVTAIELYNRQGRPLGDTPTAGFPGLAGERDARVLMRDGHAVLFLTVPILDGDATAQLFGHAVLRLDFLSGLQSEHQFGMVDPDSIVFSLREGETASIREMAEKMSFRARPNPELASLLDSMAQSQYRLLFVALALSVVLYLMLARFVARPLLRLSNRIDILRSGGTPDQDDARGILPVLELEKVCFSLDDYQRQLEAMHASLDQKNTELWTMAHRDPLTGIFNRRCFEEDWCRVLSVVEGHRVDVSFLLFDCDYFKAINDSYGHGVGDRVIQSIAHVLQGALRSGDRLYRLGGDEFACVFLDTDSGFTLDVARRCVEAVDRHDFSALGIAEPIRISVGVSYAAAARPEDLSTLQKQADVAMYLAKRPGYGKIVVYTEEMEKEGDALFSNRIANAVFGAISSSGKTLEMHYQPVVDLSRRQTDYYEALVRVRDGEELIMPGAIFPVVEGRRLEAELDMAVMARLLADLASGMIPPGTGVAINISGPAIVHPGISGRLDAFRPFLRQYKLVLEITETALITQLQEASAKLQELRAAGFVVALDDFGSGYSSLGYLANMPVDVVKFDISLIRGLDQGDARGGIVESLALMISKAGYRIVAEGIETEQILEAVMRIGCSHGQGYFLGRPRATPQ